MALSLPPPVTFLCSPSVTVTLPAVGPLVELARLMEANNPSRGTMGRTCRPDSKNSAGGAQKAPLAASSAQSMQLASQCISVSVSATGVIPTFAMAAPEAEKVGYHPVLHAAHGASCHQLSLRRTCEREEQVEPESSTFDKTAAKWSGCAISHPDGPRDCMPRPERGGRGGQRAVNRAAETPVQGSSIVLDRFCPTCGEHL